MIAENLQKTIENTGSETWFVNLFNWSGKEVCHPDKTKVGQEVASNETLLSSLKEKNNSNDCYDLFLGREVDHSSEIIFTVPVRNSDWIVGANVNIAKVSSQVKSLKKKAS